MKRTTKADQIRRHVPKGRKLPARFDDFLRAGVGHRVEWNDLDAYDLEPSASRDAVPFLRMGDGGLVALWYHAAKPAVVHIGGHWERKVIASDFDQFLKGIAAHSSRLPGLDEDDKHFTFPGLRGKPAAVPPALQKKFDQWCEQHSALLDPVAEAEALGQRVFQIAQAMLRDGRSKVYDLSKSYWQLIFQIKRSGKKITMTYLDYGEWYPVPAKYKLTNEVAELLKLVKNPKRRKYQLSVSAFGIVSIDRDRELVIHLDWRCPIPAEPAPARPVGLMPYVL